MKWTYLVLAGWLLATPCLAQEIPTWEFFGGYSCEKADVRGYYKSSPILYSIRNQHVRLNGWDVSLTENLNRWLGGTADISGHYNELVMPGATNRNSIYSIMYGPRFFYHTRWITPFTHILVGAAHAKVKVTPTGPHDSKLAFAMAAGAGLDTRLGKKIGLRLIRADYVWTSVLGTQQNRIRISTGITFSWGK